VFSQRNCSQMEAVTEEFTYGGMAAKAAIEVTTRKFEFTYSPNPYVICKIRM